MTSRSDRERGGVRLDPRLLLGMAIVAASVAGVWALVSGLDDTTEVYAVRETATPGTRLEADDLEVRSVRLGESGELERYLAVGGLPDEGVVVTRTVGSGELVPVSAVGDARDLDVAGVVVTTRGRMPDGVGPGSRVDVWSAKALDRGAFEAPGILVPDAEVVGFVGTDDVVARDGVDVELLVPRERVAAVLAALAAADAIDLVPARAGGDH